MLSVLSVWLQSKSIFMFLHLAWIQTDRKLGGLGDLNYPLISDATKFILKSYGVLIPDQGIALRGLFIIDKDRVIQHFSTMNKLQKMALCVCLVIIYLNFCRIFAFVGYFIFILCKIKSYVWSLS
ncbi:hypothetical protein GYH30_047614 [Glycine max]|uniref:Alkyl hydroperoxide reductase subunit C/ Thiol specific antioxidant domain-containing protein n=1 Tax=Glycine max TaxID=3847 RepID=K7MM65_SOYBN|nr:hypothetical protein GYH30_047614 [Glycine max]